jgi:Domain of unknown function (DUF4340)
MKIRSLIAASVVLVALIGTLYWSEHRKPSEETAKASADTAPALLKLDEATITKLELRKKDAEPLVLAKGSSGTWQITEPKALNADQSAVSSVISTLASLNSERLVEEKETDLSPYGLSQPGLEADVTTQDNKTRKLLLGDETPAGSAVYAMIANDPRVFTVASYKKTSIDKGLNDLRDKRLITMTADKISRVELTRKRQEIEFGRDKEDWQILKPKPMRANSIQVGELVSKLTDARMDLSGSDADQKEIASAFAKAAPVASVAVTDQSGTERLQVRENKGTYYAKSSAVEGTYKVGSDLGQALDKGLDDYRNKKLFDFGFSDPSKWEMHTGTAAYFLTKGGSDWWSNGKKMDAEGVESCISDLRDLTASKFVEAGFSNPTIEITVTSGDGKRIEKVSIVKSGDGYIAKRDNDSTLYGLDQSAIDKLEKAAADIKPAATAGK